MALSEAEWRETPFPAELLRHAGWRHPGRLRLFACHCCRRLGPLIKRESIRAALDTAERFADGLATAEELAAGWREVRRALGGAPIGTRWEWSLDAVLHAASPTLTDYDLSAAARNVANCLGSDWIDPAAHDGREQALFKLERPDEMRVQCAILRDLFPWREPPLAPAWLRWQGGEVPRLAEAIRAEERWDHLPVLADALEEAGCADDAVLQHARAGGPHFKGCWLVDGLLTMAGVLSGA